MKLNIGDEVKFLYSAPKFPNTILKLERIINYGSGFSSDYIFLTDCGKNITVDEYNLFMYVEKVISNIEANSEFEAYLEDTGYNFNISQEELIMCKHENKRVVSMVYSSFLYCPNCRKDLGDAK